MFNKMRNHRRMMPMAMCLAFLGGMAVQTAFCLPSSASWDPSAACPGLMHSLQLENATILSSTHLAKGSNITIPDPEEACEDPFYITEAAICRVQVNVTTSPVSSMLFEAWLPDEWYGRYLGTGNGGLAGCLRWTDLNHGSYFHFATASTNTGHRGDVGLPFFNHPETLIDFVYRDIEVEARIGKAVTKAYYEGHSLKMGKSYYTGCSAGGRTAFKAVQKYPEIFDGVVAGAPATDWNHLFAQGARINTLLGLTEDGETPGKLSDADLDLISLEVISQCDEIDGVLDGIIDDPDRCNFRPENLLCTANSTSACLTSEKVDVVHGLFAPLYGEEGQFLYPRYDPGFTGSFPRYLFGPELYSYSLDWWRYVILNDTSFTTSNFTIQDVTIADKLDPSEVSTYDPNIKPFVDRGGKLLTFHGTQDELIPSGNTRRYYNMVARTLNMTTLDPFYRHFVMPGMSHCSRGPAAWQIAQSGTAIEGLQNDTEKNVLLTMVEWVEGGKAPEVLVGTKFFNDTSAMGIEKQRTYCPYPKRSVYDKKGNYTSAESWNCI